MKQEHATRFDTVANDAQTLMAPYTRSDGALRRWRRHPPPLSSERPTARVCDAWAHYRRRVGRGIDSWYALTIPPVCSRARPGNFEHDHTFPNEDYFFTTPTCTPPHHPPTQKADAGTRECFIRRWTRGGPRVGAAGVAEHERRRADRDASLVYNYNLHDPLATTSPMLLSLLSQAVRPMN